MLSVKQIANMLNVGEAAVRRYIRDGIGKENEKLKAIKVKRGARSVYRIKQDDFDNFKEKYLS